MLALGRRRRRHRRCYHVILLPAGGSNGGQANKWSPDKHQARANQGKHRHVQISLARLGAYFCLSPRWHLHSIAFILLMAPQDGRFIESQLKSSSRLLFPLALESLTGRFRRAHGSRRAPTRSAPSISATRTLGLAWPALARLVLVYFYCPAKRIMAHKRPVWRRPRGNNTHVVQSADEVYMHLPAPICAPSGTIASPWASEPAGKLASWPPDPLASGSGPTKIDAFVQLHAQVALTARYARPSHRGAETRT